MECEPWLRAEVSQTWLNTFDHKNWWRVARQRPCLRVSRNERQSFLLRLTSIRRLDNPRDAKLDPLQLVIE
jgi:hypothetical protein